MRLCGMCGRNCGHEALAISQLLPLHWSESGEQCLVATTCGQHVWRHVTIYTTTQGWLISLMLSQWNGVGLLGQRSPSICAIALWCDTKALKDEGRLLFGCST